VLSCNMDDTQKLLTDRRYNETKVTDDILACDFPTVVLINIDLRSSPLLKVPTFLFYTLSDATKMNWVEIPLRILRKMTSEYFRNIPLNVVIDEISHHDQLQKLHDHNPLSNVRLEGLCWII
jgi:hypothetical protein